MDYQSLYLKTVVELKKMAKDMNIRIPSGANKAVVINLLLEAFQHNTADGNNDREAPVPTGTVSKENNAPAAEPASETAPVKMPASSDVKPMSEAKSVQDEEKPAPEEPVVEEAKAAGAESEKPARMRMAANPQVVNRRMPARNHPDKPEISNPERGSEEGRGKPVYASRQRSENTQTGFQNNVRANVRQESQMPRYDKRQDNGQSRYPARQENSAGSVRPIQRYENPNFPARTAVRQETPDIRPRPAFDNQPRFDGNGDNRMRGYRQEGTENRATAWQEGSDRNAFRRDAGYDDFSADAGMNRNPAFRSGGYVNRDWGYMPSDDRDYGGRDMQPGAEYPAGNGYNRQENGRFRREGYYNEEYKTSNPAVPEMLAAGECTEGSGILEIQSDGYGFLRAENYQQGSKDVYISIAQIRRFNLRMGDHVVGQTRPQREGDRYTAMMYITEVNGQPPEKMIGRKRFDELTPVYPNERLRLEQPGENDLSLRIIDMLAPIGKGQRGLIVSQPKAGKTTLLKKLANAITTAHPEIHLIVLLIDERPEEVTDMKRSISGEVVYSTFDETPESHAQVSEMVLERAQRLVEMGQDVVILMDSITRLARAYNLVIPPTGRSLSGGLDPGALHKPKRFFGAARNIEGGGSLTIIATALVDTGSRMDDIIYEEFKGTGNMELHLDRKLSDRRIFPAVDMVRSGTRREELLLTEAELEGAYKVRRMLPNGNEQGDTEKIIGLMEKTENNDEFFQRLSAYKNVYEKSGFSMSKDNSNNR